MADKFLESYDGQTTEELLALEGRYRTDSLVMAFEQAIQGKADPLSTEEGYVLAVEALEREVNNGGYSQFFINSSNQWAGVIEDALEAIGCPRTAAITRDAIEALGIDGTLTPDKMQRAADPDDEAVEAALTACDGRYYDNDEPIAERLFDWIKRHKDAVRVGGA